MNNADKHIAPWSDTDVQKYLRGELSARDMHDLELQALDDPFLADALEGLQTQPPETLTQDLTELHSRLDTRVQSPQRSRVIPWPFLRVAAAVILLAGIGVIGFYTTHRSSPEFAKAKEPASLPATIPAPPVVANTPAAQDSATASSPKADSAPSTASRPAATPPVASASKPAPRFEQKLFDKRQTQPLPAKAAEVDNSEVSDSVRITLRGTSPLQYRATTSLGAAPSSNANLVAFSGRVLDLNNRPVAGAYLTYKNTFTGAITGAVTDDKGFFNVYVPQKDSTRQLTVVRPGYEDAQYALNTEDRSGNTIYLRKDPAHLDEVVVSGVGAKRKEYLVEPPSDEPEKLDTLWLTVQPSTGRIAYMDYLAAAKKTIPVDSTIHGTESISFLVDKKGAVTEFRIERSLSPAHDAGVIRLISEGPPWKMIRGRKARALVNVLF